jgi:hypothetical protein
MIDPRFREALRKAHVDGDGEAVADIWRKVANGQMPVEETLAWAKTVGDWITETNEPSPSRTPEGEPMPLTRVDRIHAALAVTGWAEPTRDSLSDEYHLLQFATKYSNVQRTAATAIWQLIHRGKASQRTREEWLDYVAKGITETKLPDGANRRGDAMLQPIGLKGHEHGQLEVLVKILLQWMVALPKDAYSKHSRFHTVSLRKRLQAISVIPEGLTEEEEKKWERVIRDEKRALKITSK